MKAPRDLPEQELSADGIMPSDETDAHRAMDADGRNSAPPPLRNRRKDRRRKPKLPPAPSGSGRPVVMQILPSLISGGVERGTVDVARALRAAGGTPIVVSSGGQMVKQLRRAGVRHVTLPVHSKSPFTLYRNIARLKELMVQFNVDIVHARSRAPAWSSFFAARDLDLPFVTTFHAAYGHGSPLKRLYNGVMAKGDRVIAISDFIARHALDTYDVPIDRLALIPRGVDINDFAPSRVGAKRVKTLVQEWAVPTELPIILVPGRLSRIKGHLPLLEAVARLNREDVSVVIVGDAPPKSPYVKELERKIHDLGIGASVRLVGGCSDMPAAYMLADIVACPSLVPEGFGRTIAEALAMGKPVITTDHGAAPELVQHGETGWLVAPEDVEGLADTLERALALPETVLTDMGRRGMHVVQTGFTKDRMCAQTLTLYDELLVDAIYREGNTTIEGGSAPYM